MNYWILQFNPKVYFGKPDYPSEVPENLDYWCIINHSKHVRQHDRVFIWYCGKDRGIHNIGTIKSVEPHNPQIQKYLDLMWEYDITNRNYEKEAQKRLTNYAKILIEKVYKEYYKQFFSEEKLRNAGFTFSIPQGGIFSYNFNDGELLWEHIQKSKRENI